MHRTWLSLGKGFCLLCLFLSPRLVRGAEESTNGNNSSAIAPLLKAVAERSKGASAPTESVLSNTTARLLIHFDKLLQEPAVYRPKALLECGMFPEGRIYPFAIPAMAYANLALAEPGKRQEYSVQMEKLVSMLVATEIEDIRPPGNDLNRLTRYKKHGTRLATLNMVLACYALVSKDLRYEKLHDHVSSLLRDALVGGSGAPLASYPEYTWYFDTIMALVSLDMHDRARGLGHADGLVQKHFDWLKRHAMDPDSGLPVAYEGGLPRGCDLSMQVCLLQQLDPRTAKRIYGDYVKHHWVDLGFFAGFREWPKSKAESYFGDIDSGPLVFGIGPTATGVGLGGAKAMGDTNRVSLLAKELQMLPDLLALMRLGGQRLFGAQVAIDTEYVTGFLYGDTVLFYAITWVPYPSRGMGTL